jgi:protein-S-isoprenylcysteine O-methyltransferase Ste14
MNVHTSQVTFLIGLLAYFTIRTRFQRLLGDASAKERRSSPVERSLIALVVVGQVVLPALYVFSPWLNAFNYAVPGVLLPVGASVDVFSLWLFWRSHHDLGRNWSVTLEVRPAHQVVTRNVYAAVRHPMYASFLLMGVAQVLLLPNAVAGFSALVAVVLLCLVRVPREESMMCDFFGDTYRQYMRTTGSVVPLGLPRRVA